MKAKISLGEKGQEPWGLKRPLRSKKKRKMPFSNLPPLTALFEQEIEKNQEAWLERVNDHFERKFEKENMDLDLQQRMTGHYKKLNQFARRKLKAAHEKLKEAKGKHPAQRLRKDTSRLQILASASQHVSENP